MQKAKKGRLTVERVEDMADLQAWRWRIDYSEHPDDADQASTMFAFRTRADAEYAGRQYAADHGITLTATTKAGAR